MMHHVLIHSNGLNYNKISLLTLFCCSCCYSFHSFNCCRCCFVPIVVVLLFFFGEGVVWQKIEARMLNYAKIRGSVLDESTFDANIKPPRKRECDRREEDIKWWRLPNTKHRADNSYTIFNECEPPISRNYFPQHPM